MGKNKLSASKAFPLLQNCSKAGIDRLNKGGTEVECRNGEILIREGTPTPGVYFVLEGVMKVYTSGLFKRKQILRLAKEGDIVGHRGINEEDRSPITAEALEDTRCFFIGLENFYGILKEEAALSFDLMSFFANELMWSERRMKRLTQLPVRQRIADALLYVHSKFGDGKDFFLLPLRRDEIADLAATSQEQVSRTLTEFRNEGLVDLKRGAMALRDPKALRAVRDET